jgi:hypothetical protein
MPVDANRLEELQRQDLLLTERRQQTELIRHATRELFVKVAGA